MTYPQNIREEELKNKVAHDYFAKFDSTKIVGNIDFCISVPDDRQIPLFEIKAFLWAEAKKGKADIIKSLVQLILTIGKARTFDKFHPPAFIGAFDATKIAFIPYSDIHDVFYVNDFNWNVTPSNHETKEFLQVYEKVKTTLENQSLLFTFGKDDYDIKTFIKDNFVIDKADTTKLQIDKNNFIVVYNKWLFSVKPTIVADWHIAKKGGIIDGDFYLADLLSSENETLKEKLFVLLKKDKYELGRKLESDGFFSSRTAEFSDKQKAHTQFWNKYERPPKEEYWDYIVERRDLLVPQDVRERKGSFFTPQIWVELSQKYIADVLGENWQDEYTVWDCAAGTGNLLAGLTNKYNIWASTLDQQDVDVMRDRIKNGANLLESHVFQFDFLNDDFSKLPAELQKIINDPEKRKKLVMYINPPYAEATASDTIIGNTRHKAGISNHGSTIYEKYLPVLGRGINEIFAQFFIRIYTEIPNCKIAEFSKLKILQSQNFSKFRSFFLAKLEKLFVVPANTFDNVKGHFSIGFFVWDSEKNEQFKKIKFDIYNKNAEFIGTKQIIEIEKNKVILNWMQQFYDSTSEYIAYMVRGASDFQNNKIVFITTNPSKAVVDHSQTHKITKKNLLQNGIFFAVRHCIEATWLNDRDQFLYPNDGWKEDSVFQNDCLTYTLFNNNIQSQYGTNHWIPFTETEINSRDKFESSFMTDFIAGKVKSDTAQSLLEPVENRTTPLVFSPAAQAVFDAGKALWAYYHAQPNCNVNASFYDIRAHFQGRNEAGRMNAKSEDAHYTKLLLTLRDTLKTLAKTIEPKVYDYGFLKA